MKKKIKLVQTKVTSEFDDNIDTAQDILTTMLRTRPSRSYTIRTLLSMGFDALMKYDALDERTEGFKTISKEVTT